VRQVDDFDDFYRASRSRLLGFVYALTGDLGEAQDAVQEAYVRAWQRWSTVGQHGDPEAWVRVTAARIAVSRWRQLRSRARAYVQHGLPPPAPEPDSNTVEVVRAMRRLPEEQRVALALYHLMGLTVADVARETGVPVGTTKARLARGRAALARLLSTDPTGVADA
jgi:RNA polymerase sigma-70 factor (sigma-E family)